METERTVTRRYLKEERHSNCQKPLVGLSLKIKLGTEIIRELLDTVWCETIKAIYSQYKGHDERAESYLGTPYSFAGTSDPY